MKQSRWMLILASVLGLCTSAQAALKFDTLRRAAVKELVKITPMVQEALEQLRDYYEVNGVYMPDAEIDVQDFGIINRMANDSPSGAVTIHFKTASEANGIPAVLSDKYLRIYPGLSATPTGNWIYSYDAVGCVTNITMGAHHGMAEDSSGFESLFLRAAPYFSNMGCKYRSTNGSSYSNKFNTLPS